MSDQPDLQKILADAISKSKESEDIATITPKSQENDQTNCEMIPELINQTPKIEADIESPKPETLAIPEVVEKPKPQQNNTNKADLTNLLKTLCNRTTENNN